MLTVTLITLFGLASCNSAIPGGALVPQNPAPIFVDCFKIGGCTMEDYKGEWTTLRDQPSQTQCTTLKYTIFTFNQQYMVREICNTNYELTFVGEQRVYNTNQRFNVDLYEFTGTWTGLSIEILQLWKRGRDGPVVAAHVKHPLIHDWKRNSRQENKATLSVWVKAGIVLTRQEKIELQNYFKG